MTRAEALAEARRRWKAPGRRVIARFSIMSHRSNGRGYMVGWERFPHFGERFEQVDEGPSWEAAFADADRRAGCTGAVLDDGKFSHDGEACPVHLHGEDDAALPPDHASYRDADQSKGKEISR